MSAWTRLRDWLLTFGKGVQPAASEISNDELVTAYEWITYGGFYRLLPSLDNAPYFAGLYGAPDATCATLRKLGAA